MLGSPSGAVLEQVLSGLSGSAAPPALVLLPQFDPLQVSSCKGVRRALFLAGRIGQRCVSALLRESKPAGSRGWGCTGYKSAYGRGAGVKPAGVRLFG